MPGKSSDAKIEIAELVTGHFKSGPGYRSSRPNGSREFLLLLTLAGHGRFRVGKNELTSATNDVILIQPGTPLDYGTSGSSGRWEFLWAFFKPRPAWSPWLNWPEEAPGLMRISLYDPVLARLIISRFNDAHKLATGPLRRRDELAMNALEELLLWCDVINPNADQVELDDRIRQATDWLCTHLDQHITLDALAEAVGMSVSRLAHLFRDQIGTPPLQYLEQQRMRRARQLLEVTSLNVKEVAAQVGFDNPFYFTLRFKKSTGMSPTEYRKTLGIDDAPPEAEPTPEELKAAEREAEE